MKRLIALLVSIVLLNPITGCVSVAPRSTATDVVVEQLQREALSSDLAWEILASLTSEVGPRMAGSAADKRAVKWAVAKMRALGFDRVWTEPVQFPRWQRLGESAGVLAPPPKKRNTEDPPKQRNVAQKLVVTALGGSPSTHGPLEAELVQFDTLEALAAAGNEEVQGKIVFLSTRMPRTRTGSGYGETVINRSRGPFLAASKGAVALLIRSVGTDNDRLAHTGMMSGSESGERVPAAAVSNPDADNLLLMLAAEQPVEIRLNLDVGFSDEYDASSFNVVGEFDGAQDVSEFILLGAHLDSWDLGTGAIDDGAGVALVMAAAKLVADLPVRPRNGTRVVLYANEEQGIYGGKAYAKLHELELGSHLIGAESDLGAGRIYAFKTRVQPQAGPIIEVLARHLQSLGIEHDEIALAGGGADVGQMRKLGMAVIDLNQDASRYFDLHHTANDTLDKVNPGNLRQNLAAWVTLAYLTANSTTPFGPVSLEQEKE